MLGPIVNGVVIVICALVGKYAVRNMPERFSEIVNKAIGLSIVFVGIQGALETQRTMLLVMCMIVGGLLGELIDIDRGMNRLGKWIERRLGMSEGNFSKGFVSASILFCTGSMAIVGALNSGLAGDHEMLFIKSILDGAISIVFASSMGLGVAFSAIPVFLYEGAIAFGASFVRDWLTAEIITEMGATGSLIIAGIGFNFLIEKQIKVANLIPAIFLPWLYIAIETAFA